MMWISSAETRLNTHFEIAPDLDTVKKQKRELEVHFTPTFLTGFFFFRGLVCSRLRDSRARGIEKAWTRKKTGGNWGEFSRALSESLEQAIRGYAVFF